LVEVIRNLVSVRKLFESLESFRLGGLNALNLL
jgi:hypothetical protein